MGRAGRAAPRTCSTLELRTHVSSPLTVSLLPPTTTVSKPSVPSSPPSPSTPVQEAPASVTPMRQAWPQDVLQVVQLQLESIRSHSVVQPNEAVMSRKRGFQPSESYEDVKKQQQQDELAVSPGLEVELQAQTPLPQDWEQCLDLKTGQFYYFHWSTCKRAKKDPRELIRQADKCVQAHVMLAVAREDECTSDNAEQASSHEEEEEVNSQAGTSSARDACAQSSSECAETSRCGRQDQEDDGAVCTSKKQQGETSQDTVMAVLSCSSCSMIVMLHVSSPACPSCGASLHPSHEGIR